MPNYAFIGKAGSGKTTAADFFVTSYDYRRVSFAQPLKDVAAAIWGHKARADREKLQRLGVAVRDIDADAWVNKALDTIEHGCIRTADEGLQVDDRPVVIDDCRFPNEYWALKERGFVFVRINAPRSQRVARLRANGKLQDESQLEHVSETALDATDTPADYSIWNEHAPNLLLEQLQDIRNRELARV